MRRGISGRAGTVLGLALAVTLASELDAQQRGRRRGGGGGGEDRLWEMEQSGDYTKYNVRYDGRFTFVRLRFEPLETGWGRGGGLWWDHDYPRAERNLMKILREITGVRPYMDGGNILAADDPELFKYPLAYVSEPGHWTVSEQEAANLRAYLLKGGFLIFDDFDGPDWINFQEKLRTVLPGAALVKLDTSSAVFHSFFDIASLEDYHPYSGWPSEYYGVFEGNDPKKRLMVIANYNNDVGEYWEWSDQGFFPIELSNEGYKLGINYLIYALTH